MWNRIVLPAKKGNLAFCSTFTVSRKIILNVEFKTENVTFQILLRYSCLFIEIGWNHNHGKHFYLNYTVMLCPLKGAHYRTPTKNRPVNKASLLCKARWSHWLPAVTFYYMISMKLLRRSGLHFLLQQQIKINLTVVLYV